VGIDRIGKGGGVPPEALAPKDGAIRKPAVGSDTPRFDIGARAPLATPGVTAATAATGVKPSAALEGVRAGTLDVKGYVDAKVQEATAHLTHLSPTQLGVVRDVVRQQVLSDPHLAELVQHATGSPPPADDP